MYWLFLISAGVFEIGFTTALKLSDGFTKLIPSILFIIFAVVSFWLLLRAIQGIPLGTAYAVWTGIGAFGTAIIGIIMFGESVSVLRVLFLMLLILSVVGLKFISHVK